MRWLVDSVQADVDMARVWRAAGGSLLASGLGALVTGAAAIPVALLAARHRSRLASVVERSAYVGHALPGIVVALALVFFSARYLTSLYQRLPVLVFAYLVLFLPLAVSAVYTSAMQASPALDEVARSLGKRPLAVLRTVTAPLLAPGVAAGTALVFLTCMKELPATLLLGPHRLRDAGHPGVVGHRRSAPTATPRCRRPCWWWPRPCPPGSCPAASAGRRRRDAGT